VAPRHHGPSSRNPQAPELNLGPPPDPTQIDPLIQPPNRQPTPEEIRRVIEEAGGEGSRVVGEILDTEEEVVAAEEESATELTKEERDWFRSLLTCGRRYKTINVMDHSIQIQTLTIADELRIGLFCKDYKDSQADYRAYQLAVCSAAIRSIDGISLYQSLIEKPDDDAVFTEKANKLKEYYPVVISEIYKQVVELDAEFKELADKLGKH
jgi:hypothetical protein